MTDTYLDSNNKFDECKWTRDVALLIGEKSQALTELDKLVKHARSLPED